VNDESRDTEEKRRREAIPTSLKVHGFDPINLEKEQIGEEPEGEQRQTESWHSFSTF